MYRLRVGFVGCGGRNRRSHMSIMSTFDDVEIAAVCDPIADARNDLGEQYGVSQRFSDLEAMLDAEKLDAVVVATPPQLNAIAAQPCIERGIHTLMEKPPGMNLSETLALRDAAERTGAKGMVGFQRRFHPMVVRAQEMISERGPMIQIVGEFHQSMSREVESGIYDEAVLNNMIMETPIHAIDLVRAVAGSDVVEVHAVVRRAISKYKDVYAALVLFQNGCVAQITSNYTTDARLQRYEFHGRDISAYLEGIDEGVLVYDGKRESLEDARGSGGNYELDRHFIDCVKEDREISAPACNLGEAVKTMELTEAIAAGFRD